VSSTPPQLLLQSLLSEAVEEFVAAGSAPAEQMIRSLVACELAYINTSHPQFIGGNRAIAQVGGGGASWQRGCRGGGEGVGWGWCVPCARKGGRRACCHAGRGTGCRCPVVAHWPGASSWGALVCVLGNEIVL
jgi:hypothetical protein